MSQIISQNICFSLNPQFIETETMEQVTRVEYLNKIPLEHLAKVIEDYLTEFKSVEILKDGNEYSLKVTITELKY